MENFIKSVVLGFLFLPGILLSCEELPTLITLPITDITETSATSGGTITSEGSGAVFERGVCWDTYITPTITDNRTIDGGGIGAYVSNLTNLNPSITYYVRAYATNSTGTSYGNEETFITSLSISQNGNQIIADHTIVDRFDEIPQYYIDQVKKMWLTVPGESHTQAYRTGLELLESSYPVYAVSVVESGTPLAYTTSNLRASKCTWGDYGNSTGWIYWYGEEDWFTNATAISRTKAGIKYCNTHGLTIGAIGFGWCGDMVNTDNVTAGTDPVYGVHWYGVSIGGPEGNKAWGIDADDYAVTSNSISVDTYLSATQAYFDYCTSNGYSSKVFFTTGPVESASHYYDENGYQGHLKHEHIRDYVAADPTRILFDYADILCYDDNGTPTTDTWNGHTYPIITPTNEGDASIGHIGSAGAIRLAKAMWWMLARMAGWDGN